jgi:glycerol kinase
MNAKGHQISHLCLSGGQAKNKSLMQLFADTCQMDVILPQNHSIAVVLGSAILGRFAAEAATKNVSSEEQPQHLWNIMVLSNMILPFSSLKSIPARDDTSRKTTQACSNGQRICTLGGQVQDL